MKKSIKKLHRYFHVYQSFLRKRNNYLNKWSLPDCLINYINEQHPDIDSHATELDYIVVDFETTGLNSIKDHILSVGWVEIHNGIIDLNHARHFFVNSPDTVQAETAVINHILPEMLQNGTSLKQALDALFTASKNKVLVAHNSAIEANFIDLYLETHFGVKGFPVLWLDTMVIERSIESAITKNSEVDVRLCTSRKRYGLPEYDNHDALIDAISTAELFMAQIARLFHKKPPSIGKLTKLSRN